MSNVLAVTYAFMLAFCPMHDIGIADKSENYNNPTHASFQIGLEAFDCLDLYAGEETYQVMDANIFSWNPYTQSYWLGIEYHKAFNDRLKLHAGVMHKCQHPVDCWNKQKSSYNMAVTELYITVEGKIRVF